MNYKDGIDAEALCYMEGCAKNPCPRCGETNYPLLGYTGAVARWSKAWGLSETETEERFEVNRLKREGSHDVSTD